MNQAQPLKLGDYRATVQDTFILTAIIANTTFSDNTCSLFYRGSQSDVIGSYAGTTGTFSGNQLISPALSITKAGSYRLFFKGTHLGSQIASWYIDITIEAVAGQ